MADQRLKDVYTAASFLLTKQGYANTRILQIAKKAKIATGTIYNLFTGKKSILHFVLMATFDKHYFDGDILLPIKEVEIELIIDHLSQIVEPLFVKMEERREDGELVQSFLDMLSTLFDCAASYHVAFTIIDKDRSGLYEVEEKYRQFVNKLYEIFEKNLLYYIKRREVRKIDLPSLHIRNIFEGITWWAMYLPYQEPDIKLSVNKAKEIALDILKHAYMEKSE